MPQISYLTKCLQDLQAHLAKVDEAASQPQLKAVEAYIYALDAHVSGLPLKAAATSVAPAVVAAGAVAATAAAVVTLAPSTTGPSTGAPPVTSNSSAYSLRLTSPFPSVAVTPTAMGCVAYPDSIIKATKAVAFAGTYTGAFKNIMVMVPGTPGWGAAKQDAKGGWSVAMDLTMVRTGPLNCRVMAWYDDPTEKVVNLDFTLLIDNPAVTRPAPPAPPQAAGMKPLLVDDFDRLPTDDRWAFGVRPDGTQWGSDAYFVTKDGNLGEVLQLPMPSVLRIRAVYDPNFKDPQNWKRKWRSGMLCTAYTGDRPPVAVFRKGYVEMRAILPLGKGMWPSLWACQLGEGGRGMKKSPATEIDVLEGYCQVADPGNYALSSGSIEWVAAGKMGKIDGPRFVKNFDATSDWHVYGAVVDETAMTVFVDGAQTQKIQLPPSTSKDPFFWMFDNTVGGGWPVVTPPAESVDMWIDYIRIYSAD